MPSKITLAKRTKKLLNRPGYFRSPLSGSPSSGKTSLKKYLDKLGFTTIVEFPGQVIDECNAGLHNLHPLNGMYPFNEEVYLRQVRAELALKTALTVVPDRSLYDPFAYLEFCNLEPQDFFKALPDKLYDRVFILDNLPWEDNGTRYEDHEFAEAIKDFFPKVYEERGVPVTKVPVLPATEDELSPAQIIELSTIEDEDDYKKALKQILIDISIAKRAWFIIDTMKEKHPDAVLPLGV